MCTENISRVPFWASLLFLIAGFCSCAISRNYNPAKKYSPPELRQDYSLMREILEAKHPNLYWYASKEKMDELFDAGYASISDSMTDRDFRWKVIAPVIEQIHCGHTSVSASRARTRFMEDMTIPSFPLFMKVWNDSMMVLSDRNRNDSLVKRGDFVTSINGISTENLIRSMFQYITTDGHGDNLKYLRLTTSFPYYFRNIFGVAKNFLVTLEDTTGTKKEVVIPSWPPMKDSVQKKPIKRPKLSASQERNMIRSLKMDSSVAFMDLNAFTKGRLNAFFRKSFKKFRKDDIKNLIIDLRINGGGDINKAVKLAEYIRDTPFKVADTVSSVSKNFKPYSKYIRQSFWDNLALIFVSKKKSDHHYSFGYWERHIFKPRKHNHFNGNIYVLTNGFTFSAASLFCALVKGQDNVTLVGEKTGGGWYGNAGVLIPDIELPNSKVRVRLPFFRLVNYQHQNEVKGEGVQPDWYIGTNWRDVLNGRDTKVEAVLDKIRRDNQEQ